MLRMTADQFAAMTEHAREGYPHEVCGILVGRFEADGVRTVVEVHRARNANTERAHDRYELDPLDFMRVDRAAQAAGLEIIGFYHSHPDHPPRPSRTDTERAFPVYSYVIYSVERGVPAQARSWVLDESRGEFAEERIQIDEVHGGRLDRGASIR